MRPPWPSVVTNVGPNLCLFKSEFPEDGGTLQAGCRIMHCLKLPSHPRLCDSVSISGCKYDCDVLNVRDWNHRSPSVVLIHIPFASSGL